MELDYSVQRDGWRSSDLRNLPIRGYTPFKGLLIHDTLLGLTDMNTTHVKSLPHPFLSRALLLPAPACAWRKWMLTSSLAIALIASLPGLARAATHDHEAPAEAPAATATKKVAAPASSAKNMGDQVREAVDSGALTKKQLTLVVNGKEKKFITMPAKEQAATAEPPAEPAAKAVASTEHPAEPAPVAHSKRATAIVNPKVSRQYIRARAAALVKRETTHDPALEAMGAAHHEGEVHWSYEGANGPQAWGKLKSEFNACAIGKRQSPINIEDSATLQGPAEPLQFNYQPSSGTVVNNGHTIQVDLYGDNTMTVRGSTYKLLQFHFHTPSEEQINYRNYAMVAHLVHKNAEGQLAVVAVLLDPGVANALINKVWTYIPLDTGDRVRMPTGLIDMNELLPKDHSTA